MYTGGILVMHRVVAVSALFLCLTLSKTAECVSVPAPTIINTWIEVPSPITNLDEWDWQLAPAAVTGQTSGGADAGALVSDFIVPGEFIFQTRVRVENLDNDTFGVVWGWQDADNNYRLSFAGRDGGTCPGISEFGGLSIVEEIGGVRVFLPPSIPGLCWKADTDYLITVKRIGDDFTVRVKEGETVLLEATVENADTSLLDNGRIGFHVWSQPALFSHTSFTSGPFVTPPEIITNWVENPSPVTGVDEWDWELSGDGAAVTGQTAGGADAGAIVSDFVVPGDFSFQTLVRIDNLDNDTFGVVWGWQDPDNNYRLSFAGRDGGTCPGIGEFGGLGIVEEIGGVRVFLPPSISGLCWKADTDYLIAVKRIGDDFMVRVEEETTVLLDTIVVDADTSLLDDGRVGFYVQSQPALYSCTTFVPEPSGPLLLGFGLAWLRFLNERRRAKESTA